MYNDCTVDYIPQRFGDLLFKLPNLDTFVLDVQQSNATAFLNSLQSIIEANRAVGNKDINNLASKDSDINKQESASAIRTLPSIRTLTVRDNKFQFITELCPNLQYLTVNESTRQRYRGRKEDDIALDVKSLGELHPHLKRLHTSEICAKPFLEGWCDISIDINAYSRSNRHFVLSAFFV
jgi:hypothetical protein